MKLLLERIFLGSKATIGELRIDNEYICDTLEDKVRPDGVKLAGDTAIPEGTYVVKLTYSNRFKRILPELLNVPMFTGIRIHGGNNSDDTKGCILVGKWDGLNPDCISESQLNLTRLLNKLNSTTEEITITITNEIKK
jgi:hypothetical protein